MADWLSYIKSAAKTCIVQNGKRRVHYTFEDGNEMVEEYTLSTHDLVVRKHRKKNVMGKEGPWEFEVGQDLSIRSFDSLGIVENIQNPMLHRQDTKDSFQWRIRNLPYPLPTYAVTVDQALNSITIKTSNKKYYKQLHIPDMERLKLPLQQSSLSFTHANNTLILKYIKPREILDQEGKMVMEMRKMKKAGEGDVDMCSPS